MWAARRKRRKGGRTGGGRRRRSAVSKFGLGGGWVGGRGGWGGVEGGQRDEGQVEECGEKHENRRGTNSPALTHLKRIIHQLEIEAPTLRARPNRLRDDIPDLGERRVEPCARDLPAGLVGCTRAGGGALEGSLSLEVPEQADEVVLVDGRAEAVRLGLACAKSVGMQGKWSGRSVWSAWVGLTWRHVFVR